MYFERLGGQITFREQELNDYMVSRIRSLSGLFTNITLALTVVSLLVILDYFRVPDLYLFSLILIPLIGRNYVLSWYESWLRQMFRELLQ
ncbi:MAG: hypothetical protein DRG59_07040 [Deltaproteobacteria bacterium]|nr:MAG: hypothetical protein DRG83_01650 [Deltaproteobacteria bacterium]RLB07006.1 MAG: hypothetical protein DRG59_07040 [Deltaproteobacteria bacterium]